ncbi:MAG: hypothetical protein J6R67_02410 [Treponema sp.]|nr:hypothetical protein [Treponema sp.]
MKTYEIAYSPAGSTTVLHQRIKANSKAEAKAKFLSSYKNYKIVAIYEK